MIVLDATDFERAWHKAAELLAAQPAVDVGQWQSQNTSGKAEMQMVEVLDVSLQMEFSDRMTELQKQVSPNLPWAEDHFLERVSGQPLNPPPSEAWWPFAQQGNAAHKSEGEKFSHTYPERMWPKFAGMTPEDRGLAPAAGYGPRRGIRFDYGDLMDVVEMLKATPMSRQAFLPIWFPEDTGAVHGKRVPCSLGYHFQLRDHMIYVTYYIRSCDIVRHMRDDVYMAARLGQWVASHLRDYPITGGRLTMHMANMHAFVGDRAMLEFKAQQYEQQRMSRLMGGF